MHNIKNYMMWKVEDLELDWSIFLILFFLLGTSLKVNNFIKLKKKKEIDVNRNILQQRRCRQCFNEVTEKEKGAIKK